jgi:hypothetical protein
MQRIALLLALLVCLTLIALGVRFLLAPRQATRAFDDGGGGHARARRWRVGVGAAGRSEPVVDSDEMPELERFLPRYAAEPPHETAPYGRWAERLGEAFLAAVGQVEPDPDEPSEEGGIGDPGELVWYPDRTWHGRTFVPVTTRTSTGLEAYGFVRFVPADDDGEPRLFEGEAQVTSELAEENPDWRIDLCETVVGSWRGDGETAAMTLVWGRPLVAGAEHVLAELDGTVVDRCPVREGRFALLAPDDYLGDTLEIVLVDGTGRELARESLYEDDGAEDEA